MATTPPTPPRPGLAVPPGELLAEELAARGMSRTELAARMGRPTQLVHGIIGGKRRITAATARDLERVLGTPADLWVRLQGAYDLARARQARGA